MKQYLLYQVLSQSRPASNAHIHEESDALDTHTQLSFLYPLIAYDIVFCLFTFYFICAFFLMLKKPHGIADKILNLKVYFLSKVYHALVV